MLIKFHNRTDYDDLADQLGTSNSVFEPNVYDLTIEVTKGDLVEGIGLEEMSDTELIEHVSVEYRGEVEDLD